MVDLLLEDNKTRELSQAFRASVEDDIRHANRCSIRFNIILIDNFRGACAVKGNGAVAGHVKRVDHGDVFDALLFREETLTRQYFILKFDFSWGIKTNMGKTEGIFLNLQCNCHIVGSIIIKLINHRTISVHGCQI